MDFESRSGPLQEGASGAVLGHLGCLYALHMTNSQQTVRAFNTSSRKMKECTLDLEALEIDRRGPSVTERLWHEWELA